VEFQLDHVFKMDSKQEDVFNEMRDFIISVVDGYNICIFAYGQVSFYQRDGCGSFA
jgi:hypothetical protein